jgi:hypothetical protein
MRWGSFTCEFEGERGYSGQANRWVMKCAHKRSTCSWPQKGSECRVEEAWVDCGLGGDAYGI